MRELLIALLFLLPSCATRVQPESLVVDEPFRMGIGYKHAHELLEPPPPDYNWERYIACVEADDIKTAPWWCVGSEMEVPGE